MVEDLQGTLVPAVHAAYRPVPQVRHSVRLIKIYHGHWVWMGRGGVMGCIFLRVVDGMSPLGVNRRLGGFCLGLSGWHCAPLIAFLNYV